MRARLCQERIRDLMSALDTFSLGRPVVLKEYQRLLGRMAAAATVCHLGLLYMCPLQIWLRTHVPKKAWRIVVTRKCLNALEPWWEPDLYHRGVQLGLVTWRKVVTTDVSTVGWGAHCDGVPASGRWTESERTWHINRLELRVVFLALQSFITQVQGHHVLIRTDNMSVVSYINCQGGVRSRALHEQAAHLLLWADCHLLFIRAAHVPGCLNSGATYAVEEWNPSRGMETEPQDGGTDLGSVREGRGGFVCDKGERTLPSVLLSILPQVLHKLREERVLVLLIAPYWLNRPWFPDLLELLAAPPWPFPLRRDLLSQAGGSIWHPNPEWWKLHVWLVCGNW
ncbi:ORF V: Enzymatic polyprotein [Labeo rohita]|uniref:ORF V: Enzymatic polyprotein n=1 Tax=Labeo rohita TaxID=84645 RepID=A0ABQ8L4M0_LABRO|nr:ORF V: Enzymatic polyprotein [Labeo rohita]